LTEEFAVHDDLAGLQRFAKLPAGSLSTKWTRRAVGASGRSPGPTDSMVIAYVTLTQEAWAALAPASAPAATDERPWELPAEDDVVVISQRLADVLLPTTVVQTAERTEREMLRIRGSTTLRQELGVSPYRARKAVRLSDGLYIALQSM
jgi:hypothetical protein